MDALATVIELPESPLPRRLYKSDDGRALFRGDTVESSIDAERLIVTAIISTPVEDSDNDIVEPEGLVLDQYNGVVLWEHGFEGGFPIGTSLIDGQLAVRSVPTHVEADCQFTKSYPESYQLFELIQAGIVRATSARISPIDAVSRRASSGDGFGAHVKSWWMPEWSWTRMGANHQALVKSRGGVLRVNGSRLLPMFKSLVPIKSRSTVAGIAMPTKTKPKSDAAPVEDDEPKPADEQPKTDEAPVDETPAPEAAEETSDAGQQPYGSQVLAAVHGSLSDAVANISAALGPMEQPEVKEYLATLISELEAKVAEVEGMHGSKYPEADPLEKSDDPEDEALKSWLKSAQGHRLQFAGFGGRLKRLAAAKNLTADQRTILNDTLKGMGRIERQATDAVKAKSVDQKAIDALAEQLKSLKERIGAA